jgi:hypothetical protein
LLLVSSSAIAAVGLAVIAVIAFGGTNRVGAQGYSAVSGIQVAGVSLNPGSVVPVADPRPTIQGTAPAGSTVSIRVTPGDISLSPVAGADGSFRAQVPSTLAPGTFAVFINGQAVGSFSVAASAPSPPATGSGGFPDAARSQVQLALFVFAGLLIATGAVAALRRRLHRR